MTTMIREIYEALKEAGASEEKATAAAEVLARDFITKEDRARLAAKEDIQEVRTALSKDTQEARAAVSEDIHKLETRLAAVEAELGIVKWIVSGVGFGVLLLVIKSFWPGG